MEALKKIKDKSISNRDKLDAVLAVEYMPLDEPFVEWAIKALDGDILFADLWKWLASKCQKKRVLKCYSLFAKLFEQIANDMVSSKITRADCELLDHALRLFEAVKDNISDSQLFSLLKTILQVSDASKVPEDTQKWIQTVVERVSTCLSKSTSTKRRNFEVVLENVNQLLDPFVYGNNINAVRDIIRGSLFNSEVSSGFCDILSTLPKITAALGFQKDLFLKFSDALSSTQIEILCRIYLENKLVDAKGTSLKEQFMFITFATNAICEKYLIDFAALSTILHCANGNRLFGSFKKDDYQKQFDFLSKLESVALESLLNGVDDSFLLLSEIFRINALAIKNIEQITRLAVSFPSDNAKAVDLLKEICKFYGSCGKFDEFMKLIESVSEAIDVLKSCVFALDVIKEVEVQLCKIPHSKIRSMFSKEEKLKGKRVKRNHQHFYEIVSQLPCVHKLDANLSDESAALGTVVVENTVVKVEGSVNELEIAKLLSHMLNDDKSSDILRNKQLYMLLNSPNLVKYMFLFYMKESCNKKGHDGILKLVNGFLSSASAEEFITNNLNSTTVASDQVMSANVIEKLRLNDLVDRTASNELVCIILYFFVITRGSFFDKNQILSWLIALIDTEAFTADCIPVLSVLTARLLSTKGIDDSLANCILIYRLFEKLCKVVNIPNTVNALKKEITWNSLYQAMFAIVDVKDYRTLILDLLSHTGPTKVVHNYVVSFATSRMLECDAISALKKIVSKSAHWTNFQLASAFLFTICDAPELVNDVEFSKALFHVYFKVSETDRVVASALLSRYANSVSSIDWSIVCDTFVGLDCQSAALQFFLDINKSLKLQEVVVTGDTDLKRSLIDKLIGFQADIDFESADVVLLYAQSIMCLLNLKGLDLKTKDYCLICDFYSAVAHMKTAGSMMWAIEQSSQTTLFEIICRSLGAIIRRDRVDDVIPIVIILLEKLMQNLRTISVEGLDESELLTFGECLQRCFTALHYPKYRKPVQKHAHYLILSFINCEKGQSNSSINKASIKAVTEGIFCLFDIIGEKEREFITCSLDSQGKSLYQALYSKYMSDHRFHS